MVGSGRGPIKPTKARRTHVVHNFFSNIYEIPRARVARALRASFLLLNSTVHTKFSMHTKFSISFISVLYTWAIGCFLKQNKLLSIIWPFKIGFTESCLIWKLNLVIWRKYSPKSQYIQLSCISRQHKCLVTLGSSTDTNVVRNHRQNV
jgi:hypothetical protein